MKFKLSIIIFTIILTVFYFQMVSCKSNEDPQTPQPVYSNYTGELIPNNYMPSIYDIIKHPYRRFKVDTKEYSIMVQSDIDKLNNLAYEDYLGKNITIKATYSNSYFGHKRGYDDDYLFDISIVSLGE